MSTRAPRSIFVLAVVIGAGACPAEFTPISDANWIVRETNTSAWCGFAPSRYGTKLHRAPVGGELVVGYSNGWEHGADPFACDRYLGMTADIDVKFDAVSTLRERLVRGGLRSATLRFTRRSDDREPESREGSPGVGCDFSVHRNSARFNPGRGVVEHNTGAGGPIGGGYIGVAAPRDPVLFILTNSPSVEAVQNITGDWVNEMVLDWAAHPETNHGLHVTTALAYRDQLYARTNSRCTAFYLIDLVLDIAD